MMPSINAKSYEKTRKEIARYLKDSLMESINASNLGMIFTINSKWNEQQKFDYAFGVLKKTTEALHRLGLCYGKLVLAYSGIDWKKETNGHEQMVIDSANKALEKKKELVYGLDFDLLRGNIETTRILRNFFAHYEDETRRVRKFTFKIKKVKDFIYPNVVLNFKEINKSEASKSFDITISSREFLNFHVQFYIAYTILERNYALFHVGAET